jgi:Flp pilus assembly protein TadD
MMLALIVLTLAGVGPLPLPRSQDEVKLGV